MKDTWKNNLGLKVLAVLFAVFLWWTVVNVDDPVDTKKFSVDVNITNPEVITNAGKSYQIVDDTKNITVTVKARRKVLDEIRKERPDCQCAKRQESYVEDRIYYENILRNEFLKKGGRMDRRIPHYMVVEHSPWLGTWYENSSFVKIPIEEFDISTLSFTYGDSHPTFSSRVNDGKV